MLNLRLSGCSGRGRWSLYKGKDGLSKRLPEVSVKTFSKGLETSQERNNEGLRGPEMYNFYNPTGPLQQNKQTEVVISYSGNSNSKVKTSGIRILSLFSSGK